MKKIIETKTEKNIDTNILFTKSSFVHHASGLPKKNRFGGKLKMYLGSFPLSFYGTL
jgi:hypothetical protein